jgi:hypothetical protein
MAKRVTLGDGDSISYGFAIEPRAYRGLKTMRHGGADAS